MNENNTEKKPFLTRFFIEVMAHIKVPHKKFDYKKVDMVKADKGINSRQ